MSTLSNLLVHIYAIGIILLCYDLPVKSAAVADHPCMRICEWPPNPRNCEYNWSVESFFSSGTACSIGCPHSNLPNPTNVSCHQHPDCILLNGVPRPIIVVNKSLPGPSIQVCEGDTIIVHVTNNMEHADSEGLTIHWHGIKQYGTAHMDGVLMITQCPILIHQTFTYSFKAHPAGTHWWHAHSGLQRADGVFGSLIVQQPIRLNPNSILYDHDLPEHVIMLHDWYNVPAIQTLSTYLYNGGDLDSDTILMNGIGLQPGGNDGEISYSEHAIFNVVKGQRYRFRIISSTAGRQLRVLCDNHTFKVIGTECSTLEPFDTSFLAIHSAERFDLVLEATQEVGNYWFRVQGVQDCEGCEDIQCLGIIHYEGAPEENPKEDKVLDFDVVARDTGSLNRCEDDAEMNTKLAELNSTGPDLTPKEVDVTFYIGAQQRNPASSHPTLNHLSFYMPPSPLLHQSQFIPADDFCYYENYPTNCENKVCSCINTLHVKLNQVVEMVLVNEGDDNPCHPMHIHGHSFHVVAQGTMQKETTLERIKEHDRKGLIHRKLTSAPVKDSVHIPQNGYTIVRFVADNPGWWFFHCHIEWHVATGMALVLKVGSDEEIQGSIPTGFPTCGAWSARGNAMPPVVASIQDLRFAVEQNSILVYNSTVADQGEILTSNSTEDPNTTTAENRHTITILMSLIWVLTLTVLGLILYLLVNRSKQSATSRAGPASKTTYRSLDRDQNA